MSRDDPRVEFLHSTISSAFGLHNEDTVQSIYVPFLIAIQDYLFLKTVPEVIKFLEDGSAPLLCVSSLQVHQVTPATFNFFQHFLHFDIFFIIAFNDTSRLQFYFAPSMLLSGTDGGASLLESPCNRQGQ